MNKYKVYIYNEETSQYDEFTKNAVIPYKFANLLDEQLDETSLTLVKIDKEIINPLTKIRVQITNEPEATYTQSMYDDIVNRSDWNFSQTVDEQGYRTSEDGRLKTKLVNGKIQQILTVDYIQANDNSIEYPVGSSKYQHELYAIELTKIMEGYIGDTLTFRNAIGNDYLSGHSQCLFDIMESGGIYRSQKQSQYYTTPKAITDNITIKSFRTMMIELTSFFDAKSNYSGVYVTANGQNVYSQYFLQIHGQDHGIYEKFGSAEPVWVNNGDNIGNELATTNTWFDRTITPTGNNQLLEIKYVFYTGAELTVGASYTTHIRISTTKYPIKKWTITSVINRITDLIEPLKYGDAPKFRLQGSKYDQHGELLSTKEVGSQAEEFDEIIAPEFSFTKMNLREMLQQVGGYIHAEPRITAEKTDNYNRKYYEIKFDKYGGANLSNIKNRKLISSGLKLDINNYCTGLDSQAENMVSQIDYAQGVIIEPFEGYYKTLRTENTTVRLAEDNSTFISSSYPIYKIGSETRIICNHIPGYDYTNIDITPYVFEKVDYDNLSSYSGEYPYSKSYALYYTMGEKNIKGLFFKAENAISPALTRYAIINILREATGNASLNVTGQNLLQFGFTIIYLPIFEARIKINKSTIIKGLQRNIAYNQSANMVESRYYGEHLKGVIARLGNVDKTHTYQLALLSDIPKTGYLFDGNYYISTMTAEVQASSIKVTTALSKNFNRKSNYIGVDSIKRMWQVSEKNTQERQSIYTEYIKISQTDTTSDSNICYYNSNILARKLFNKASGNVISSMEFYGMSKDRTAIDSSRHFVLPVVSTAMGNSMLFVASALDNYTAGQKIEQESGYGWWGEYSPYCDYYGKFYYLYIKLGRRYTPPIQGIDANLLPEKTANSSLGIAIEVIIDKWKYRKDTAEIPTFEYQLTAVTDEENLIIGSELMRNCSMVNRNGKSNYYLYAYYDRIDIINGKLPTTGRVLINNGVTINNNNIYLSGGGSTNFMAWAIITEETTQTITVEDDDGNVTTQTIKTGGELVLGENFDRPKPFTSRTYYFTIKRKIGD